MTKLPKEQREFLKGLREGAGHEVEYRVSLHPSKFLGYQEKSGESGTITLYLSTLWRANPSFEGFLDRLIWTAILERICIERAFQKIRLKNRCEPICVVQKVADLMAYPDEWEQIREFWRVERILVASMGGTS